MSDELLCATCGGPLSAGRMVLVFAPRRVTDPATGKPFPSGHVLEGARDWPLICSQQCGRDFPGLTERWGSALTDEVRSRIGVGLSDGSVMAVPGVEPSVYVTDDFAKLPEAP